MDWKNGQEKRDLSSSFLRPKKRGRKSFELPCHNNDTLSLHSLCVLKVPAVGGHPQQVHPFTFMIIFLPPVVNFHNKKKKGKRNSISKGASERHTCDISQLRRVEMGWMRFSIEGRRRKSGIAIPHRRCCHSHCCVRVPIRSPSFSNSVWHARWHHHSPLWHSPGVEENAIELLFLIFHPIAYLSIYYVLSNKSV